MRAASNPGTGGAIQDIDLSRRNGWAKRDGDCAPRLQRRRLRNCEAFSLLYACCRMLLNTRSTRPGSTLHSELLNLSPALIVEDDPAMQQRLKRLITEVDGRFEPTVAGSLKEAH